MSIRIQNRSVGVKSPSKPSFSNLLSSYKTALTPSPFAGLLPSVLSAIPSAAIFFTIKDTVKNYLLNNPSPSYPNLDIVVITIISIFAATPFYWLIRTPFESVKTTLQTADTLTTGGSGGGEKPEVSYLYNAFIPNMVYAFPADVFKFCIYEYLTQLPTLSPPFDNFMNPACLGAASTMISQGITTPLDLARNRIMCYGYGDVVSKGVSGSDGVGGVSGYFKVYGDIMDKEGGVKALMKGVGPRIAKASVSGAVQFFVYDLVLKMFPN
jgi:hypothetical protein